MKGLFVGTAGWMACADAGDPAHEPACKARDTAPEAGLLLVTTDYVMGENIDAHSHAPGIACREIVVGAGRRQFAGALGMGRDGTRGKGAKSILSLP